MDVSSLREINLNKLNQNKITNYLAQIEAISDNAGKEFTLENALEKMEREWDNLNFVVLNYKGGNIKVL